MWFWEEPVSVTRRSSQNHTSSQKRIITWCTRKTFMSCTSTTQSFKSYLNLLSPTQVTTSPQTVAVHAVVILWINVVCTLHSTERVSSFPNIEHLSRFRLLHYFPTHSDMRRGNSQVWVDQFPPPHPLSRYRETRVTVSLRYAGVLRSPPIYVWTIFPLLCFHPLERARSVLQVLRCVPIGNCNSFTI